MRKLITIVFTCFIILCGGSVKADAATLHVAHSSALSWSASYTIVTSGNKIKNVSNIKVSTRLGAITKTYMTKDFASKVTLYLVQLVPLSIKQLYLLICKRVSYTLRSLILINHRLRWCNPIIINNHICTH